MAHFTALVGYGLAVGLSLGLTGGGGSIIAVPLLVYLVGERTHVAVGTSLVIVGGVAVAGFLGRIGLARIPLGLVMGVIGLAGAVPGTLVARHIPDKVQLGLFAVIMLIAAAAMFGARPPDAPRVERRNWPAIVAVGIGIGFLTGLLGIGGGFLIVPALVLALGIPMRSAIPTSLLVIAINCVWSLLGRLAGAEIDWPVAVVFLAGGLAGNAIGALVAARLNQRQLRRVFAAFVFAVGLFVGASATGLIPIAVK